MKSVIPTPNSKPPTPKRCHWCGNDDLYTKYHDEEWGKEVHDDKVLFEFLILEAAQAGLSWITILRKRENYRRLFADFDAEKVAAFTEDDIERILLDPGIIRNRLKVVAAVNNAKLFLGVQKEFGSFDQYLYSFMPDGRPIKNEILDSRKAPATTQISDSIAKDMKKRGFKFFGSTICYAHMQATGMVNDHALDCDFR
ncbi:MAG: DNA-3-methyladenine glycosylase I [Bacteroidetes bacterium]|nr:DNA-3-methyladenine glycosylase I [Bacteroidota bacterium]MBU1373064.1 DNA-3-methyladenine glycosylase I [Bacteroidota bacterium]MBU1484245.1 DNA-3-methyladenine glycosylase I [Bacteroidota bacterium]MBU1761775.1 DNA-3-methyladenine glycosylase I [Bacteroidota bacterium]MBU2046485.1 DNA-3-methyladenine glycosylase I [Bacteroidota bacterium]